MSNRNEDLKIMLDLNNVRFYYYYCVCGNRNFNKMVIIILFGKVQLVNNNIMILRNTFDGI